MMMKPFGIGTGGRSINLICQDSMSVIHVELGSGVPSGTPTFHQLCFMFLKTF